MTQPDDQPIDKIVGQRIREMRETKGLTRAATARATNVSEDILEAIEDGQSRATSIFLIQFAELIGIPLKMLFS